MNTLNYLPKAQQSDAFWIKLCDILDYVITTYEETDYEKFKNKWNSLVVYDKEISELLINELGYGYVLNILNLTDEEEKILANYLNAIHYLKGHRQGLELIFTLLGIKYVIKEWWELPDGIPYTFVTEIEFDYSKLRDDTIDKLRSFIRQYVYPTWIIYGIYESEYQMRMAGAGFVDQVKYNYQMSPVYGLARALYDAIYYGEYTTSI